ncbi:acyltransferase family protein [Actinomadura rifamycini]|uniref:acyltransferase family protein n=1 Tax=Actinomadura rifamycini TaxID=31962 RepID=UPI000400EEF6|nr:acyltransferase [Actinomadura rifamycini]
MTRHESPPADAAPPTAVRSRPDLPPPALPPDDRPPRDAGPRDLPPLPAPARTGHGRLRELDLLRFLAAVAVVLYHFTGFDGAGPWPEPSLDVFPGLGAVTSYGYLGVDLFFVISGFVILLSAWGRGPGEFGVSRLVRLMPAYWFSVLLGAAVYAVFRMGHGAPGLVIPNLTMLQGGLDVRNVDAVYWTLWVELHFYVLVAVLAGIGITYRSCLVFMAAWLFGGLYANQADNELLQVMLLPTWSPYFIGGMALFMIYKFGPTLLLWGYVAVSWLLALHWGAWRARTAWEEANEIAVGVAVTGIFALMSLVALGRLRWIRWRGLTVLGALTYPLYLVHSQLALPLVDALYPAAGRWGALAATVAASLLLSYAVHRLVEGPAARWMKARLRASLEPVRAAGAAGTRLARHEALGGRRGPGIDGGDPRGDRPPKVPPHPAP